MIARALWHDNDRSSSLHREAVDDDHQRITVRSAYSLVSAGTEALVARGEVPGALQQRMQVPYQAGSLSLPVKYGYSLVGKVEKGPPEILGQWAHLLHPHQDLVSVHTEDLTLIPKGMPPARAALASNMETAVNAVWDAGLGAGDRVLVVGFGLVGALVALLAARYPGTEVMVAEPRADRQGRARALGLTIYEGQAVPDLVFHASATSEGLQLGLDALGKEGTLVELSWYGSTRVDLDLGGAFHPLRQRIISSQVSSIPPERQPRWDYARRKAAVMRILAQPVWDDLLDDPIAFEDLPALFDDLRAGIAGNFSYLIQY